MARPRSLETPPWGKASAAFGVVAIAAFAWIWALSSTSFNPPNWLRIAGAAFYPVGIGGALVLAALAWRVRDRLWPVIGTSLAIASIAGLIVLATVYE